MRCVGILCMALLPALLYAAPHHVVIGASDCSARQELEAEDGMPFTLVAEPRSNASFLRWSDGTTDNPYLLHITSDTTITAIFSAAAPALTHTLTLYADTCEDAHILEVEDGKEVTLVATPGAGYTFSRWSDGNTDNPRRITADSDATFRALFAKQTASEGGLPTYAVTLRNSLCADETTRQFIKGANLKIYATSDECRIFTRWSDGNTDNPRSVMVTGDATYTAEFTREQYTITTNADNAAHGTVSVATDE